MNTRAIALGILVFAGQSLYAAEYYVSKNGNDSNPGTLKLPWGTLAKANAVLSAGDTVFIRGGDYKNEAIKPLRSGTVGKPITYKGYDGEVARLIGGYDQANLNGRAFITLDGLYFESPSHSWVVVKEGASYITIKNSHFKRALGWPGIEIINSSHHKIQNNSFVATKEGDGSYYPADQLWIQGSTNNLIEKNDFQYAGHQLINFRPGSHHNVVRNNVMRNPYHSNLGLQGDGEVLVEGNLIFDAGADGTTYTPYNDRYWKRWDHLSVEIRGNHYLIRNNILSNNGSMLVYESSSNNRIYNNTFHADWYGFQVYATVPAANNIKLKNNIFSNMNVRGVHIMPTNGVGNFVDANNFWNSPNNIYKAVQGSLSQLTTQFPADWTNNSALDPKFTNPAARDFTLQSDSKMIDAGRNLTTVTSATGSGSSFTVGDALYFSDGLGVVSGDFVMVGSKKTQIRSVNYDTNVITVTEPVSWAKGDSVNLLYSGVRPDLGALESGVLPRPQTPVGVRLTIQ